MKVAVIGAGISGIGAAKTLGANGFDVVVFEKSPHVGGVWATAYPGVRLQNTRSQYYFTDFPWPTTPDLHPTSEQIRQYLAAAVEHYHLDVRTSHEVVSVREGNNDWLLTYADASGMHTERFGYVVVAAGQYTGAKHRPAFPGESSFRGRIITEREVTSHDMFDKRDVVVVGFGKTAVDMAAIAGARARSVHHVFRSPRWLIPEHILGVHFTFALFNRFNTMMMPSWGHPTAVERFLHARLQPLVDSFWRMISGVFARGIRSHALENVAAARARLAAVTPDHDLQRDLRSAAAMAPENYYAFVADGRIHPKRAEVAEFTRDAVRATDGTNITCDLVVLCTGSESPAFPFLSAAHRALLEREADGPQLYRHLVHPRIQRLGFAGFNHGFMHVPSVEIGTLWLSALIRGHLELPSMEDMERTVEQMRAWKRERIQFEPSRGCATSTRFQQYLDVLLLDLGLSPYRKLPNVPAEIFARYDVSDYASVQSEYDRIVIPRGTPTRPVAVPM